MGFLGKTSRSSTSKPLRIAHYRSCDGTDKNGKTVVSYVKDTVSTVAGTSSKSTVQQE